MKKKHVLSACFVLLLVALDQGTKFLAGRFLKGTEGISLIPGVFRLYYLEGGNSGAAFGILQGQFWFFAVLTVLILAAFLWILLHMPEERRFRPLRVILLVLSAGALGNFIDRVYTYITEGYNYVIDFLYFELINFPIFNVADCYITFSTALFLILFLFYYKDEDLGRILPFLRDKDKEKQENKQEEKGD